MDVTKMKVADLKKELKVRNLSTVGNKQELQQRLQEHLENDDDTATYGALDDGGGDVSLDDEEDEELSGTSPPPAVTTNETELKPAPKKIILNRNNLPPIEQENIEETPKSDSTAEHKTVKTVVSLTEKERLELRAKKFGSAATKSAAPAVATAPRSEKSEARAIRFGTGDATTKTGVSSSMLNIDVLKKRAERFGTSVSTVLQSAELEEKKRLREQRFKINGPATKIARVEEPKDGAITQAASKRVPITGPDYSPIDEKKRLRAERFKTK